MCFKKMRGRVGPGRHRWAERRHGDAVPLHAEQINIFEKKKKKKKHGARANRQL